MAINYDANKKYFKSNRSWTTAAVIVGVIGLMLSFQSVILLLIALAVAAALVYIPRSGRPTAASLDQQCQDEAVGAKIKERALLKLGIDEDQVKEIDPIFFDGYTFNKLWNPYFKKEEEKWRSSNYEAAAFFFSSEQVYCYKYTFSLTEDSKKETTEEYFYKDIVAAATASDEFTLPSAPTIKPETINFEHFRLTTSGGTSISASFRDMEYAAKSINGMKQLLRQKKSDN